MFFFAIAYDSLCLLKPPWKKHRICWNLHNKQNIFWYRATWKYSFNDKEATHMFVCQTKVQYSWIYSLYLCVCPTKQKKSDKSKQTYKLCSQYIINTYQHQYIIHTKYRYKTESTTTRKNYEQKNCRLHLCI